MFSGVPSVFKGRNAVRVPPRAQHSPSSEGVFALTCVQSLWSGPSDARLAGCGLAAPVAYGGVWVAGSGSWLVGPPPALGWGYAVPRSGSVWLVVDGQHQFMVQGSGYNMMKPALARKSHGELLRVLRGSCACRFVLPKGVWTVSTRGCGAETGCAQCSQPLVAQIAAIRRGVPSGGLGFEAFYPRALDAEDGVVGQPPSGAA